MTGDRFHQATATIEYTADESFPNEGLNVLRSACLFEAPLASHLGGLGWGSEPGQMGPLLTALMRIGARDLAVARLWEGHVNALLLLQTFADSRQIETAAVDASHHRKLFAVWNTQGPDGVRITPTADGQYRLSGSKTFASGAGSVERALITGSMPNESWQMVLVPMDRCRTQIDTSTWDTHGMRATQSFTVDFSDVTITQADLIGSPGDYYQQPWFSGGAIRFAAAQLGGAVAILDAAREELRLLGRTDDTHQRVRIADSAIAVTRGLNWLASASAVADCSRLGGMPNPQVTDEHVVAFANMFRTEVERICLDVLELAEQSIGARAFRTSHRIERFGRDLRFYLRQPAPDASKVGAGDFVLASPLSIADLFPPAQRQGT